MELRHLRYFVAAAEEEHVIHPVLPEEIENPWLLLHRDFPDKAIPAIADATSLTYALHLAVGDDFILRADSDRPVRLRIVAALADSVFQRELLIAESHFLRLFPEHDGYRFFLTDPAPDAASEVSAALENRLSDFGIDVAPAMVSGRILMRAGYSKLFSYCFRSSRMLISGQARDLLHRPDLDGPFARHGNPCGNADRLVEILCLDEEVAAQLFPRLREWTIGHEPFAVAHPDAGRH
jgi:hypothetical protein